MSAITIHRFGQDTDTLSLSAWDDTGGQITITGSHWMLGVPEGRALRQQLLGLASDPTRLHLLTSTDDPHRDGFYRVANMQITSERLLITDGHISWTGTLERPAMFRGLRPELTLSGANRSGKPAGITARHWFAAHESQGWGSSATGLTIDARYLLGGDQVSIVHGSGLTHAYVLMSGGMETHFDAACHVKMDGFYVVGEHTATDSTDWEMANGFVTVTPGTSPSAICSFIVQDPGGGGAVAPTITHEIEFGRFVSATWTPSTDQEIHSVSVLHESVEMCMVRILGRTNLDGSSYPRNAFSVDLTLRRGDLGVGLVYRFTELDNYGIGFVTPAPGGYEAITASDNSGLVADSDDADGMREAIVHLPATFFSFTRDLTNGRAYLASLDHGSAEYWVGSTLAGASSSDADNLQQMFMSTVRETQSMVAP